MPELPTKYEMLEILYKHYSDAYWYYEYANESLQSAYDCWAVGNLSGAITWLIDAIAVQGLAIRHLIGDASAPSPLTYPVPSFFEYYSVSGWKGIIEAWIENDFEARTWTIATLDRMRQIVWNEPYNFIWAARPEDRSGEL